jgi:ADP-heptose:LPS heptosyltransferase
VTPHDTCPHIYVESWKDAALPSDFDSEKPFITVCTGAGWQNKRWPVEYWRKLVSGLSRQGHRIVQLGTGIDERIGDPAEDWIDRTTLKQAACILRQARLMICCDSGLMHLAMAVGRPTLALFGPTNPDLYAPRNPLLTTVQGDPLCTGCWNNSPVDFRVDTCPLNRDSCLATVSPEVLMERIQRVLRTDS